MFTQLNGKIKLNMQIVSLLSFVCTFYFYRKLKYDSDKDENV